MKEAQLPQFFGGGAKGKGGTGLGSLVMLSTSDY